MNQQTFSVQTYPDYVLAEASMGAVTPEVLTWTEWDKAVPRWSQLVDHAAFQSLFLTTDWVSTWLSVFGKQLAPEIVFFRQDGRDIAACLLVTRTERRGPVPVTRLYLNASGEDESDEIFIENNNLLCLKGCENAAVAALAAHLSSLRWDELVLDGCADQGPITRLAAAFPEATCREQKRPNYYIDLDKIRASGKPYESILSSKTRYNVRQNLKAYEAKGDLRIHFAASTAEAQEMLTKLAEIHQRRWQAKNLPGVFSSEKFFAFHRNLIDRTFALGGIDLVEVSAGGETLGLLYNFVFENGIAFYQCGFEYTDDKKLSPGQFTLFMAIREYLQRGRSEFDFMAGDTDYKRWMSTDCRELSWTVVERPGWKRSLISSLGGLKQRYLASRATQS